ncbi:MAG: hypothetical protein EXS60_00830 [Candidatus Pacebacteria bacterium]|nr:hypothetical protein [Candidatus Paceibacterota bacterium]
MAIKVHHRVRKHCAFACAITLILIFGAFCIYLCVVWIALYRPPHRFAKNPIPISFASPMPPVTYPKEIRVLYITASTAYSPRMEDIVRLIKASTGPYEPNAVIIDIQDSSGRVVMNDDMRILVRQLRFLKIFPIARLVAFQNNAVAKANPSWAIHLANGALWRDNGGRHWLDASNKEAWEHIANLSRDAIKAGFAEINYDYFRFPSEGVTNAVYPYWSESVGAKPDIIVSVAKYLKEALKKEYPNVRLTADIFGYTFMRKYDMGIGQSAPALAAVFDDVCPMIYPSHYSTGNFNFVNPADHPYEVMAQTLAKGKEIFADAGVPFTNIRPWVQDFDMGAIYTPKMVREQMRAISDAGLPAQWLIWNPRNKYREAIFDEKILP